MVEAGGKIGAYMAMATVFSGNNPNYKPWGAPTKRKTKASAPKKAKRKKVQASRRKNR